MIIEIGSIINKTYRIEKYIGDGSMGKIYLVERIKDGKKMLAEKIAGPGKNAGNRYHILFKEIFSAEGSDDMSFFRKYGFLKSNTKVSSEIVTDGKGADLPGKNFETGGSIILPLVVISLLIITICGLLLGLSIPGVAGFLYY